MNIMLLVATSIVRSKRGWRVWIKRRLRIVIICYSISVIVLTILKLSATFQIDWKGVFLLPIIIIVFFLAWVLTKLFGGTPTA